MRRWLRHVAAASVILAAPGFTASSEPIPSHVAHDARSQAVRRVLDELAARMTKATPEEALKTAIAIVDECLKTGYDPLFVLALIEAESKFDIEAVSPTGARGLMQLIPQTFRRFSSAKRMFDPVENVRAGIRYLGRIAQSGFKRPETVLLAYNQGAGVAVAVVKEGAPVPEEAEAFVPKVLSVYQRLLKKHGFDHRSHRKLFLRQV